MVGVLIGDPVLSWGILKTVSEGFVVVEGWGVDAVSVGEGRVGGGAGDICLGRVWVWKRKGGVEMEWEEEGEGIGEVDRREEDVERVTLDERSQADWRVDRVLVVLVDFFGFGLVVVFGCAAWGMCAGWGSRGC